MFDCLAQLEDCRDYMNEIGEVLTRASGLMGTGLNAGEKIDNLEEAQVRGVLCPLSCEISDDCS